MHRNLGFLKSTPRTGILMSSKKMVCTADAALQQPALAAEIPLLNASCDPTRELGNVQKINCAFWLP